MEKEGEQRVVVREESSSTLKAMQSHPTPTLQYLVADELDSDPALSITVKSGLSSDHASTAPPCSHAEPIYTVRRKGMSKRGLGSP